MMFQVSTFILILCLSLSSTGLAQEKRTTAGDATSLTTDFLQTDAFAKSVLSVYNKSRSVDIECKVRNGRFWYFSYTGVCENCVVRCTNPTKGMMSQCIDKCQDYMLHQHLMDEVGEDRNEMKEIKHQLLVITNELEDLKVFKSNAIIGFVVGAVALFAILIFAGICFIRYANERFETRRPNNKKPTGDEEGDEMIERNKQATDSAYTSASTMNLTLQA